MTNSNNEKKEGVQVYPEIKPVTVTDVAMGGTETPSDVMTGGGKVKSAAGVSEGIDDSAADKITGSAGGSKMGMAKSDKLPEPDIGTITSTDGSRSKPHAKPADKNKD